MLCSASYSQITPITLHLSHVCFVEIAWVLISFYKLERAEVAAKLKAVILHSGVICEAIDVVLEACESFATHNIDFIDCYNAALAQGRGAKLASFDKDDQKFPQLQREPL